MFKDSFNNSNYAPNTFFGDYQKRLIEEKETTLSPENGNGCLQTQKIASQKEDLVKTNFPCAPAVFSVKEGTYGPGIKSGGVSDEKAGHSGIVLSCKN